MQILKHYIIQNAEEFLSLLNAQKDALLRNEYGVEKNCIEILEKAADFLQKIGEVTLESRLKNFTVTLHTSISGVHPYSMELLKINKRQFVRAFTQDTLVKSSTLLEELLESHQLILKDASNQLEQVLLSILQANPSILDNLNDITAIENFWDSLCSGNPQVMLLHKKLLLKVTKNDIHILLDKSVSKLKMP